MADYYAGRVHSIVHEDPSQEFYVLRVVLDGSENGTTVPVRGHIEGLPIQIGTWFGFEGDWVQHPKYGQQLLISRAPVLRGGWDPDTVEKMLVSEGIGERLTHRLRQHFGDEGFIQALASLEALEAVPGITKFGARHIHERWMSVQAYFQALTFLHRLDLPRGKINAIWSTFGDEAEKILAQNPWALVQIDGISFKQADAVATRLGLDPTSPGRVEGAVLYACKNHRGLGHLYTTTGTLFSEVKQNIENVTKEAIAGAVGSLHRQKLLFVDRSTRSGVFAVYEPWAFRLEDESAAMLHSRVQRASFAEGAGAYIHALTSVGPKTQQASLSADLHAVVTTAVEEWGAQSRVVLSEMQKQGVINALTEPVSVLTGLPGTGKTTSLRAAVRILQDAGIPFLLVAPTGIAAKNLAARTGAKAYTIHRGFAASGIAEEKHNSNYTGVVGKSAQSSVGIEDPDTEWGYSQENPYPAQVVIVDEASMVDQHLLYRLLSCTSSTCRMVFVGDSAQLPSVGPGNVLRDMITSGLFPVVRLTEIFRQANTSDIVYAAHEIHAGRVPRTDPPSEFVLVEQPDDEVVLETILKLAYKCYQDRHRIKSNFQILSPRHAGTVGVTNLNARLRELINPRSPGQGEIKLGEDSIREGDRVMVVKNNYTLEVYNGDVGKVNKIDKKAKLVEVKIHGDPPLVVQIKFSDVPRYLRLAYACTVHKAQGLEYDCIIMPMVMGFRHQLQRNLTYTAITRARKKVILVGTRQALANSVLNGREDNRNTLFIDRLTKLFAGGPPPATVGMT